MSCHENKGIQAMPLFEYTCQSCSSEFELLLRNSEDPLCPECNSDRLNRHLSAASFQVPVALVSAISLIKEPFARTAFMFYGIPIMFVDNAVAPLTALRMLNGI